MAEWQKETSDSNQIQRSYKELLCYLKADAQNTLPDTNGKKFDLFLNLAARYSPSWWQENLWEHSGKYTAERTGRKTLLPASSAHQEMFAVSTFPPQRDGGFKQHSLRDRARGDDREASPSIDALGKWTSPLTGKDLGTSPGPPSVKVTLCSSVTLWKDATSPKVT